MKRRLLVGCICLVAFLGPALGCIEDEQTLMLARVLYANCAAQPDDTLYAYAEAICNRVGMPEFGDTLTAVLAQHGQYATGSLYDERTLQAARATIRGRTGREPIPDAVVYAAHREDSQSAYTEKRFWRVSGEYVFYGEG